MKHDLISIIVPMYNTEKYLAECIESISSQSYRNFELLLIDDGSTDGSPNIAKKYTTIDTRIKFFKKENTGVSDTRNFGIKKATGKYIAFVDSDDYIDKNYVELLLSEIISQNADIAMTTHYIEYPNIKPSIRYKQEKVVLSSHDAIDRMLYYEGIYTFPWGKIYKKKFFSDIKYPEGKIFEDTATTPLLLMKAKNAINNTLTYHYVIQNSGSITNSEFAESKMELIYSTEKIREKVLRNYSDLEKGVKRRIMFSNLATLR